MQTWIRSAVVVLATGFVGFFGAWQADFLVSQRGTLGPTVLQGVQPIFALGAILLTVGVSSVVGAGIAKLTSTTTGMFVFGFGLFAMSMKMSGSTEFIVVEGNFYMLMLESAIFAALVLAGTLIVFGIGGPIACGRSEVEPSAAEKVGKAFLLSLVTLPVVWFIANSPEKGQVIGSAALAGVAVGLLGRQFLRSTQPILLFVFPILVGGVGYFVGLMMGDSDIVALNQQSISRLLLVMPMEYASGIVIGLAIVLGWTSSVEEKPHEELAA